MLVTLVGAMGIGWWLDHAYLSKQEQLWRRCVDGFEEAAEKLGWSVAWNEKGEIELQLSPTARSVRIQTAPRMNPWDSAVQVLPPKETATPDSPLFPAIGK